MLFWMKELGELKHFLGLEVNNTKKGLFLCQEKYTRDLLRNFGMLDWKPISLPMEANAKLCADECKHLEVWAMYQQLVGSLICRTLTRPDISFVVSLMSWYVQYAKGTINYGLLCKKCGDCELVRYYDANYTGYQDTH